MEKIIQRFTVGFDFPVYFTRDAFSPDNPAFLEALTRLEPERRHRVLVAIDGGVARTHPRLCGSIRHYFAAHPARLVLAGEPLLVPGGEKVKNDIHQVLHMAAEIDRLGIDRQSFVAVIGGGAVLDMVCFAAALAHRGVRAVRMPTTVLSQCDSGVGVKSAINFFGKKNFLGAFLPPFAVINDSRFIETLSLRNRIAGLAEAVKVALVRDRDFFEQLERAAPELSRGEVGAVTAQIRRSALHHIEHIRTSGDPFELGSARPLDFGHWAAHKIESMSDYRIRHGEAVALGMALDSVYSVKAGYLPADRLERILGLLATLGFELWDDLLSRRCDTGELILLQGLEEFRKHLGGVLHISLLRDIGHSFEVHEIDTTLVRESIEFLCERKPACLTPKNGRCLPWAGE